MDGCDLSVRSQEVINCILNNEIKLNISEEFQVHTFS